MPSQAQVRLSRGLFGPGILTLCNTGVPVYLSMSYQNRMINVQKTWTPKGSRPLARHVIEPSSPPADHSDGWLFELNCFMDRSYQNDRDQGDSGIFPTILSATPNDMKLFFPELQEQS